MKQTKEEFMRQWYKEVDEIRQHNKQVRQQEAMQNAFIFIVVLGIIIAIIASL